MILSADRIRELLENPPSDLDQRLFITPLLNANAQLKRGNASVDLRLGQRFSIPRRAKLAVLDHLAPEHQQNIEKYKDESFIRYGIISSFIHANLYWEEHWSGSDCLATWLRSWSAVQRGGGTVLSLRPLRVSILVSRAF
jgi:hypothetical protein